MESEPVDSEARDRPSHQQRVVKNKFLSKEIRRMEVSNITGKVVVITGASSGIGESTAKLLAEQGSKSD